jgi:hypothetical protein
VRRRTLLFAGLAFAAGLVLGILLFLDLSSAPDGPESAGGAPAEPRLAPGVTMTAHNLARLDHHVRFELRDAQGRVVFQDGTSLEQYQSFERSTVNLLEGRYELVLFVDGTEQGREVFGARDCGGGRVLTFSLQDGPGGSVVVRSMGTCR